MPRGAARALRNTPEIELWPGGLLRARGSRDARALARATTVLRRKRDGAYLAADLPEGLLPLVPRLAHEPGLDAALAALEARAQARPHPVGTAAVATLPLHRVQSRLRALCIDEDAYARHTGLAPVAEPALLAFAGRDRYRRPLWLLPDAARAWAQLQAGARREGVVLEAISGYRSHDYQLGIFERKLVRGQSLDDILTVNAAPGYSEHHGGRALDIGTPGEPPAEASFADTAAHAWLQAHAGAHGFVLSYPEGNPHGIVHEPWHWCFGG